MRVFFFFRTEDRRLSFETSKKCLLIKNSSSLHFRTYLNWHNKRSSQDLLTYHVSFIPVFIHTWHGRYTGWQSHHRGGQSHYSGWQSRYIGWQSGYRRASVWYLTALYRSPVSICISESVETDHTRASSEVGRISCFALPLVTV